MIQREDGSILMAYRGRHDEVLPLATAPHFDGPFTRVYPRGQSAFPSACSTQLCNGTLCSNDPWRLSGETHDISARHSQTPYLELFKCLEDPFLLRLRDGSYHMIMHNQVGAFSGAHAFSADGINWTLAKTPAYTKTVEYIGGRKVDMSRREEPKMLFENGKATHL